MAFISVFNDVLGPVMRGPSSSHTAGGYRVGKMVRDLLADRPAWVRVTFDPEGSMAPTYQALGVDLAVASGLMGWSMLDERYIETLDRVRVDGIRIEFEIAPLEHTDHPNGMLIEAESIGGRRLRVVAEATGGGGVRIVRIDDWQVDLDGKSIQVLVEIDAEGGTEVVDLLSDPNQQVAGGLVLLNAGADSLADRDAVAGIGELSGVKNVWSVWPVFFIQKGETLFESADEMVAMAEERHWSLGEMALAYEGELLGMTESDAAEEMLGRFKVMERSVEKGLDDGQSDMLLLQPRIAGLPSRKSRCGRHRRHPHPSCGACLGGDALLQQPWGRVCRTHRRLGRYCARSRGDTGRRARPVQRANGAGPLRRLGRWSRRRQTCHVCRRAGWLPGGNRRLGCHGCGGGGGGSGRLCSSGRRRGGHLAPEHNGLALRPCGRCLRGSLPYPQCGGRLQRLHLRRSHLGRLCQPHPLGRDHRRIVRGREGPAQRAPLYCKGGLRRHAVCTASSTSSLARISHRVSSRGRRGVVPSGVCDPRGAECVLAVRRAPRGEKTPLGEMHRRPQ